VILLRHGPGVLAAQDAAQTLLQRLEREPVAAGCERIALSAVLFVCVRVPRAAAHALDQCRTDAVTFDRQRVIGVGDIDPLHLLEIGVDILRPVFPAVRP
jgi:hypothetical protein